MKTLIAFNEQSTSTGGMLDSMVFLPTAFAHSKVFTAKSC